MIEVKLLPTWLVINLITLGGIQFQTYLRKLQGLVTHLLRPIAVTATKTQRLRKLSHVLDPEGKVRVIAVFDYWSQTVLKPLHSRILEVLRCFKADCTFNQTGRLYSVTPNPNFYCYDLTAATDRFPLCVQEFILSHLIGADQARAWSQILTRLPFYTPEGDTVAYATGQPMGAYSSWPVFALSHHLVVQVASHRAGFNLPYDNYMLLGDDIVIGDDKVANNYLNIMAELGVTINLDKS